MKMANQAVVTTDSTIEFLGGLIDKEDVSDGPFKTYVNLGHYDAFTLRKDCVGFPGCIGLKEINLFSEERKRFVMLLWPHTPPKDTKEGYLHIGEPKPVASVVWNLIKENNKWVVEHIGTEIKIQNIYQPYLDYVIKLLSRAKKIWPERC